MANRRLSRSCQSSANSGRLEATFRFFGVDDGVVHSAFGVRTSDGRDLRAHRGRLYAALADIADDKFRPRRIRYAAGVLRSGGDEHWCSILVRLPGGYCIVAWAA